MFKRSVNNIFFKMGSGFFNTTLRTESSVNNLAGRGNAGTNTFFIGAAANNIKRVEEEGMQDYAANPKKRGYEREAEELEAKMMGKGGSSH
jgi:hypothetical protein